MCGVWCGFKIFTAAGSSDAKGYMKSNQREGKGELDEWRCRELSGSTNGVSMARGELLTFCSSSSVWTRASIAGVVGLAWVCLLRSKRWGRQDPSKHVYPAAATGMTSGSTTGARLQSDVRQHIRDKSTPHRSKAAACWAHCWRRVRACVDLTLAGTGFATPTALAISREHWRNLC